MELIDKCVHCGKPKNEHRKPTQEEFEEFNNVPTGLDRFNELKQLIYYRCDTFKSITVAAAEKNAVRNLELLIEVHEKIGDLPFSNSTLSFPLLRHRIEQAIEDSTPKE